MTEIVNLNGLDIRFELHGEGIPIVYMTGGFYPLEQGRLMAERLTALGYKVRRVGAGAPAWNPAKPVSGTTWPFCPPM